MNQYVAWSLTALYYLIYPLYFLLCFLALTLKALLSPITSLLLFLLQPLVLFAQLLVSCALVPIRLLQKFETLYIYLGVASITGISCGLLLHFVYSFLHSNLHLASEPAVRGPTSKQYRASRRRKDMYQSDPMISPSLSMTSVLDTPGAGRYGLLAQTIHEEDSDF